MTEILNESPTQQLGDFFDTLWHDTPGYVYLPTLDRATEIFDKVMFKWPSGRQQAIQHVLGSTAKDLEVYCAPAIFKEAKQPIKDNVLGSWVIWSEYDGSVPEGWTSETPEAGSVEPVPHPSLMVQTSSDANVHAYWKLDKFETDTEWIENTNRAITYDTRADTSGWDCTQILRPPHTRNYKYADKPIVTVAYATDVKYNRARFSTLPPVKQLVSDAIDVDKLPAVGKIVAHYRWSDEDWDFFDADVIPEGHRSDALMRLGYIGAEMGMTDPEIYSILNYADNKWKKYVNRLDRKTRLLDIINRAKEKHPRGTNLTFSGLTGEEVEIGRKHFLTASEFLKEEIEVTWAIEDFIEVGGMGMVAASPGIGKTQLSLQMAIDCILGKPFLDWNIPRPLKIAFLSLEMSRVALKKFLSTIVEHYTDDERVSIEEGLILIPRGEALPLSQEGARPYLHGLLEEIRPDGLIIDSFGKLTMGKMDEEIVKKLNNELGIIRKKFGCFIWLIHHNRKTTENNKGTYTLDDIFGSVYITAEQSAVLLLWKGPSYAKNKIKVYNVKNRLAEEVDPFILQRDEHLHFTKAKEVGDTFVGLTGGDNDSNDEPADKSTTHFNM